MSNQEPVRIMKGISFEHFHNVPGELDLLTVTPEKQAVFEYLSAVGPDRFQEFVADILTFVESHQVIDITGGPGDEKQDILSKAHDGSRQLTQCKHAINFATKSKRRGTRSNVRRGDAQELQGSRGCARGANMSLAPVDALRSS